MPSSRQSSSAKKPLPKSKLLFFGAILLGLALLIAAFLLLRPPAASPDIAAIPTPADGLSAEQRLDAALQDGRPTFVFLHSLTCVPCQEMMGIVAQVYPDFEDAVTLVDVNVDDKRNDDLVRREHVQVIPTLVFYDKEGGRLFFMGVMQPDQLRSVLQGVSQ